jgi:hypothetical protein
VRAAALADPRGFLEAWAPPVIFDEVQYAPELLPYVKERIDAARDRAGQYLLSGSQNLLLLERVTESLAGRAAVLRLLPLSWQEAAGRPEAVGPWWTPVDQAADVGDAAGDRLAFGDLWQSFLRGGYPELVAMPDRNLQLWHASYLQTYVERDVRTLRQVGDLTQFQSFLRVIAARSGQLLNLSDVGRDLGIAVNTVKAWLSVLEASYQVTVLRPYFANVGKRLVKTPKIYLSDVGTLCYLSGLRDAEHAAAGPLGGAILETAVLSQIVRTMAHRGEEPRSTSGARRRAWRSTSSSRPAAVWCRSRSLAGELDTAVEGAVNRAATRVSTFRTRSGDASACRCARRPRRGAGGARGRSGRAARARTVRVARRARRRRVRSRRVRRRHHRRLRSTTWRGSSTAGDDLDFGVETCYDSQVDGDIFRGFVSCRPLQPTRSSP